MCFLQGDLVIPFSNHRLISYIFPTYLELKSNSFAPLSRQNSLNGVQTEVFLGSAWAILAAILVRLIRGHCPSERVLHGGIVVIKARVLNPTIVR